ncbi:MAG TPA: hypothetical protein DEG17_10585 [Cyanobacteria bacterium UBA11149]|nr:hypothetical protein [Cyanobacteria bacterium UBA11367]HBE56808.1 hypothetical protein [Cyanobacteria bacterium UBA11366]HBK64242.1 hypothetical protein [Cyanobacteria bacterium UBA11166]HBR73320.1 hypothetical protein [Cyanobacteria bacterium UBA11159]HBS72188.1 hypothetical protein [Cyanobacteria bacterium UBA11153]HBW89296.1 hypothetical protein [Cyanobacteria bacterium UBA11149]HCA95174.1 hypothetical protein [Cyanobacteria bacterium UBA9226]
MERESQQPLHRKLLGYFMVDSIYGACLIVDWRYCVESLDYPSGDEEYPQIIIPTDAESDPRVPRYYELGYIPAGVYPSIDLRSDGRQEAEITEYVDIPVYVISKGDFPTSIYVDIEGWIPRLEIVDEEPQPTVQTEEFDWIETRNHLTRKLFGYVSATGGGILICNMDLVRLCRNYHNCLSDDNEIIAPPEGESPGFRTGVVAHIPEELQDREFPVYGEYEGDLLKRITVEIDRAN